MSLTSAARQEPAVDRQPTDPTAETILESVFGFTEFRGPQKEIIQTICRGDDALVLMPTGGGKSLCYQIPALLRSGVGIVVSPLIALMTDQVESLRQAGVAAAFLNSSLHLEEQRAVEDRLLKGELDLLYLAPERLSRPDTLALLARTRIALIAIDEAHCVSQWGHDFRPEYLQLGKLPEHFSDIPRIALTATADEPTRAEIIERLNLGRAQRFISSFDRPNITYRVTERRKGNDQLVRFIQERHAKESGIVYCLSRSGTDSTTAWLNKHDIKALPYHAGMSSTDRQRHQRIFISEDAIVMVATIAFGMGIDKPDVRFVAHMDLPASIEAYYQETGRSGRDGLPAEAWMVYGLQDVVRRRQMLENSDAPHERKQVERAKLDAMLGYCELTTCRRISLLRHFGEQSTEPCGNCDVCLEPPQTWDATEAARKALSAVYRSGQRFGASHIIDILRGGDTEKIRRFGHQHLTTYGIGGDLGAGEWRSILRQLIARGFLRVDVSAYNGLTLGEHCRAVLRGEQTLELRRQVKSRHTPRRKDSSIPLAADELPLWDALREARRKLAIEQSVPPYVIFHDSTLLEMVRLQPRNKTELAAISGVGATKLARYGEHFLAVILDPS